MNKEKISKVQTNKLIDMLIKSGGGKSQYGKLNEIIKTYTTENSSIRNTLLIWLDSMGIMEVDNQNHYFFNKPHWVKSSIENHYILFGALTESEIEELELNDQVKKYIDNKILFKNFEIELPDTYYTLNTNALNAFNFKIFNNPIFSGIENMEGLSNIEEKLFQGPIEKIIIPKEYVSNDIVGYKIILNADQVRLDIDSHDDIKQFNWRTRNYIKCDLIRELTIEPEEEGLKLIKVTKLNSAIHKEYFTILLEKTANKDWKYIYFDRRIVDERWARYLYIDKLKYYDIEKDFRGRTQNDMGLVSQNAKFAIDNKSEVVNNAPASSNFMKIPNVMIKQMVQYDSRQGFMAFPVSMPLPKVIMRYLFSCSGKVPHIFKNKFVINPDYNVKRLFSGVLSPQGNNVPYPNQKYFMEEDFYLFSSVPTQLAEKIFEKLNLDINEDVFKRTFLQKV
jgi:hypothetical protein